MLCKHSLYFSVNCQLAHKCSKSTLETPEQCVKSVQSWQLRHQKDATDLTNRSSVSIADVEQTNASLIVTLT